MQVCRCHGTHEEVRGPTSGSQFSSPTVGSRDQIQVIRLAWQALLPTWPPQQPSPKHVFHVRLLSENYWKGFKRSLGSRNETVFFPICRHTPRKLRSCPVWIFTLTVPISLCCRRLLPLCVPQSIKSKCDEGPQVHHSMVHGYEGLRQEMGCG